MHDFIMQLPAVTYEYAVFPKEGQRFNYIGDGCPHVIGVGAEELKADPQLLFSHVHPPDHEMLRFAFAEDAVAGPVRRTRVRVTVGGELKYAVFTYSNEIAAGGVIIRRGIIQQTDFIERFPSQATRLYESLFRELPIGVVIHEEGVVLFANKHAHQVIGAKEEGQLTGMNALSMVHPRYVKDIGERIKKVKEGDSVPLVEEKFIALDGRIIDVETMAFPFLYDGRHAVQVIFRDISDKKKAEAQVRRNETLFTQLFQNLPMAVVMLDDAGKVSEVNKGFESMFGYTKDELRGKNLNDFIVPENLQNEGIDLNNLITSNKVVTIESIRRHRSGKLVNVILCGVPVMFDNEAIGIYGVYVDISDRKQVEEELKIRNAELDNFVYKVSHDLRAPLSSVLGLVNLSKMQGNTDNPLEYISIIGEKVQALDHFIGDVLSHSKNLKLEVEIGLVDLNKIVEQTFTDLGYLNGARRTRRLVKIEGIDFYSDRWRISEIFRNLVSNAIKYRKPDADDSEIIIRINVDHLCADISFTDNGIGINESNLKRIFEMFYRATDQSEGSGIGLYIVKNAVEKLGGQIRVASTEGEGTRFHILLPNRINSAIGTPIISPERHENN